MKTLLNCEPEIAKAKSVTIRYDIYRAGSFDTTIVFPNKIFYRRQDGTVLTSDKYLSYAEQGIRIPDSRNPLEHNLIQIHLKKGSYMGYECYPFKLIRNDQLPLPHLRLKEEEIEEYSDGSAYVD